MHIDLTVLHFDDSIA